MLCLMLGSCETNRSIHNINLPSRWHEALGMRVWETAATASATRWAGWIM